MRSIETHFLSYKPKVTFNASGASNKIPQKNERHLRQHQKMAQTLFHKTKPPPSRKLRPTGANQENHPSARNRPFGSKTHEGPALILNTGPSEAAKI